MKKIENINEFYQSKKYVRNNNDVLLAGIDVSKKYSDLCITDTRNNILLKKFRFQNTKEGLNIMLNKINFIKEKYNKQDVFIGFEPTGRYHKTIASNLLEKDIPVYQISTVIAKHNRRSLDGSWRKNDPKDALNIADLMSRTRVMFYPLPDSFYDGLKELVSYRYKLSKRLTGLKIMIRNSFFAIYFPEIENVYKNMFHPEVLKILYIYPSAYDIKKLSLQKFIKSIYKKNPPTSSVKALRLQDVWDKAKDSIACPSSHATSVLAKSIVSQVEFYQARLSEVEKEIECMCTGRIDYELLLSLPGFGPIHSAAYIACVKDINNYHNIKQLRKLAGFDLEYQQSGQFKGTLKISKKGSVLLRHVLCSAATIALKNKTIKKLFLEKLKIKGDNRDNQAKLKIKFAEKLLRITYAVLRKKESFSLEQIEQYSVKQPVLTNVRTS